MYFPINADIQSENADPFSFFPGTEGKNFHKDHLS